MYYNGFHLTICIFPIILQKNNSTFKRYYNLSVPVAHNYKPMYSRDRDQEDSSSRPAQMHDPILKIPNTKRAGGVAQWLTPA
jgi:hypothetical protein